VTCALPACQEGDFLHCLGCMPGVASDRDVVLPKLTSFALCRVPDDCDRPTSYLVSLQQLSASCSNVWYQKFDVMSLTQRNDVIEG